MEGIDRKPRLLNKNTDQVPAEAVYIGRGSPWGNMFHASVLGRYEAIKAYEAWAEDQPELMARAEGELKGMDLVCHCWPRRCHGEYLYKRANGYPPTIS